jgi:DNA-binding MarR family transcriptional regulator
MIALNLIGQMLIDNANLTRAVNKLDRAKYVCL